MRRVRDLIAGRLRVIHRSASVAEVRGIFDLEHISGAPLFDTSGEGVGIISKSDCNHVEFTGGDASLTEAWEVGSMKVLSIPGEASIQEAARLMLTEHVHRIMVTDEEGGPMGVVSSFDFVRLVAETPPPG